MIDKRFFAFLIHIQLCTVLIIMKNLLIVPQPIFAL